MGRFRRGRYLRTLTGYHPAVQRFGAYVPQSTALRIGPGHALRLGPGFALRMPLGWRRLRYDGVRVNYGGVEATYEDQVPESTALRLGLGMALRIGPGTALKMREDRLRYGGATVNYGAQVASYGV